jgi:deferrochelatase/peroxidase EfeB
MGATLELADIQGNILATYGKMGFPKARTMVLHVTDAQAGRNLVETLRRRVTTALPWETEKRRPIPGQVMAVRPAVAMNLAFTFRGLLALGVPIRTLRGMPDEFIDGMAARADILGDVHVGADGKTRSINAAWDPVWLPDKDRRPQAHILVTMHAGMDPETGEAAPELAEVSREILGMCSLGGVSVLEGHRGDDPRWQDLSAVMRQGADGRWMPMPVEHFGFADGISDTVFEGQMALEDLEERAPGQGKLLPDGRWAPLATGEFLLGWPDESQEIAGAAMPLDFSRNGTFMAYRKLHQNVVAWRRYMERQAERYAAVMEVPLPEAAATIPAKMAGRWMDGTPLVIAPTYAAWQEFRARRDAARDDASRAAFDRMLKEFTYGKDPLGAACPMGAHIRRANTRDMLDPLLSTGDPKKLNGSVLNNRRRILRRGLPYGRTPPETAGDDSGEHGIVLMAQCASLFRQFEFVQQQWMQYGLDFNAGNETCPIIGNHLPGEAKFVIAADPASGKPPFICADIPQFVETRGGEYFFIPSMTALRMIAQGLVDPT